MSGIRAEQVEAMGPNAVGKCQAGAGGKAGASPASAESGTSSSQSAAGGAPAGARAGTSAAAANAGRPPGKPVVVVDPNKAGWLLIELVDETGAPVPAEPYQVKLPNGKIIEGNLDAKGAVRIEGIDQATSKVTFPQRDDAGWKSA